MKSYGKELPITFWDRTGVKTPKFQYIVGFQISIEAVVK